MYYNIFIGSDDGYCCVWSSDTLKCISRRNCGEVVRSIATSRNGDRFIVGGGATMTGETPTKPLLLVFLLSDENAVYNLIDISHSSTVRSVAMSKNGGISLSVC